RIVEKLQKTGTRRTDSPSFVRYKQACHTMTHVIVGVVCDFSRNFPNNREFIWILAGQGNINQIPIQFFAVLDDGKGTADLNAVVVKIEMQVRILCLHFLLHGLKHLRLSAVPGSAHSIGFQGLDGIWTFFAARSSSSIFLSFGTLSIDPKTLCHPEFLAASSVVRATLANSLRIESSRSGLRSFPDGLAGSSIARLLAWSRNSVRTCTSW